MPGPLGSRLTHSAAGVIGVDPLLGLVVFAVWHALLVPPALAYAPVSLGRRLPTDVRHGLRRWLRLARLPLLYASLGFGAGTPVFWDGFTHAHAWTTRRIPVLSHRVGPMPAYHWAQYASGVAGALILIVWAANWWRHAPVSGEHARLPPATVPWQRSRRSQLPDALAR